MRMYVCIHTCEYTDIYIYTYMCVHVCECELFLAKKLTQ